MSDSSRWIRNVPRADIRSGRTKITSSIRVGLPQDTPYYTAALLDKELDYAGLYEQPATPQGSTARFLNWLFAPH